MDKSIKVIMLTVHEEKDIVDRAKELGADEYIAKPFRIDYLEEVVIKKVQELLKEKNG
jgi:PleD family two-component response regulator